MRVWTGFGATFTFVPKRTNPFQQVVKLVYEHLAASGVAVKESHMLTDRVTKSPREVDVALISEPADGVEVIVAIEATGRKRKLDLPAVEALLAKHNDLPTSKLIIVSNAGFYDDAREKAEHGKAIPVTPEEVEADPARAVVSRLGSVWAKTLELAPESVAIWVRDEEGNEQPARATIPKDHDLGIFASDGTFLTRLREEVGRRMNADLDGLHDELGIRDRTESVDAEFTMNIHGWEAEVMQSDGNYAPTELCLRWEDPNGKIEYQPIMRMRIRGRCKIDVVEVSLTHMKIGGTAAAFGQTTVDDGEVLLVVTEDDKGNTRASLRQPDGTIADLKPGPDIAPEADA